MAGLMNSTHFFRNPAHILERLAFSKTGSRPRRKAKCIAIMHTEIELKTEKMKYFLLVALALVLAVPTQAQLLKSKAVRKFVENQVEKQLEKVLKGNADIENLSMDDFQIKRNSVKAKGSATVKIKDEALDGPVRFKAKVNTSGKLGLRYFKVHLPGHSILGFPLYKRVFP